MDKTLPYAPGEEMGGSSGVRVEGEGEQKCFINEATTTRVATVCGGPLQPLSDYKDEEIHPSAAQTTAVGLENVPDLLLSRGAGIFNWRDLDLSRVFICKDHNPYLIRNMPWEKGAAMTGHEGRGKRRKTYSYFWCPINVQLGDTNHQGQEVQADGGYLSKKGAQAIFKYRGTFFQPGTPLCEAHRLETSELVEKWENKQSVASSSAGSNYLPSKGSVGCSPDGGEGDEPCDWDKLLPDAKRHIRELASDFHIPINLMVQDWPQVSPAQKKRKAQEFFRLIKYQSRVIHKKDYGDEALSYLIQRQFKKIQTTWVDPEFEKFLNNIAEMFSSASSPVEKRRALV
jgi:hypothetical protein